MTIDREKLLDLIDATQLVPCEGRGPIGWVYFIVCADTRRCKIGFTKAHPEKRLANLQTGSPGELVLCVMHPGTPDTERQLHERFASSRIRGEWFELTDELRAYMTVALWAMSEISLRQRGTLDGWMTAGLSITLEHLESMPESLIEALGVD